MINKQVFVALCVLGLFAWAAIWLFPDRDKAPNETANAPQATTSLLPQRQASLNGFRQKNAELMEVIRVEENSKERDRRLMILISQWFDSTNNPNEISEWIQSIEEPPTSAFEALAFRWVALSPSKAIEWVSTIDNTDWREGALEKCLMRVRSLREKRLEHVVSLMELAPDPMRYEAILKRTLLDTHAIQPNEARDVITSSNMNSEIKNDLLSMLTTSP